MRKFVAIVAAVLATPVVLLGGMASASAADDLQPPPRGCSPAYHEVLDGEVVAVFCDFGPADSFRVVAQCESEFDRWTVHGSVAETGGEMSLAECRGGFSGTAHVYHYYVNWMQQFPPELAGPAAG